MSEDPKKLYQFFKRTENDFETFTWKIFNVSSIPQTIDYVVQSPSFSFCGSDWILKMYPYGRTGEGSKGYIDVVLQKLHHQIKQEEVLVTLFCEDIFDRKCCQESTKRLSSSQIPNRQTVVFHSITQSFKINPEKWRIAPNDTFKLVCGLQNVQIESSERNLDKRYRPNENDEIAEIGEISKGYLTRASFLGKICDIQPVPTGYAIHLPFDFAKASWTLKIYPYFRMENSSNESIDFVLQRLHSDISEHYVDLEITMTDTPAVKTEQAFFFDVHHAQGGPINFPFPFGPGKRPCIHFDMVVSIRSIATPGESYCETMSIKSDKGNNSSSGSSIVLQNFKKLYLQQEDCDVVFKVKGKEFKAHKLILKAQSPVLASAFRIDMKEKATGIYEIEDCEPAIFSDFLHFLYCGEVENLSKDNVFGLFTIADKYDISNLRVVSMEFIKKNLSAETFCDTIALALLHCEAELVKLSTDFFAKNLQEIIVTARWKSFIQENPIQGNELIIKALVPSQTGKES